MKKSRWIRPFLAGFLVGSLFTLSTTGIIAYQRVQEERSRAQAAIQKAEAERKAVEAAIREAFSKTFEETSKMAAKLGVKVPDRPSD